MKGLKVYFYRLLAFLLLFYFEFNLHYLKVNNMSISIRNETLTTNIRWVQPTPEEIRLVISLSGWSQSETARFLGVTTRQVNRWVKGEAKISYSAWAILCHQAGLGKIWG